MLRSLFRRRLVWIAALLLVTAAPVSALAIFLPSVIWQAAIPITPSAAYSAPIRINPAPPPNGYGDVIYAFETGRDDRSPYAAIVVTLGPTNPFRPSQVPAPMPEYPPGAIRFVYRPINDPANPGWPSLPGAVNQLDSSMQTAAAVGGELGAFRSLLATAAPPFYPSLYLEYDPTPSATWLEFYKMQIMR